MFGVGRATVTRVLRSLTEGGYLEGHRGIGTFTKHQNFIPVRGEMPPLVGLLAGDGKYFYYPYHVWSLMANSGLALTRGGCNVRTLNLTGPDEETLYTEITHQYLDGLVALDIGPQRFELIRRLREEAGLKVILQVTGNIDADAVGADSFSFDFRQAGVEIGRRLLAEGRSKLYFIFLNQVTAYLLEGIRSAFAAGGDGLRLGQPRGILRNCGTAPGGSSRSALYAWRALRHRPRHPRRMRHRYPETVPPGGGVARDPLGISRAPDRHSV